VCWVFNSILPRHRTTCADKCSVGVEIDLAFVLDEAKDLEMHLQAVNEQAKPVTPGAPESLHR